MNCYTFAFDILDEIILLNYISIVYIIKVYLCGLIELW